MLHFTPITKTATSVLHTIAIAAKDRKIKPEAIDFDLLSFQTFFKAPQYPEWTLLEAPLETLFEESMIRSSALELRQEYEIRLRPYDPHYLPLKLDMSLASNKTKSKVVAIIKPGTILPCVSDIKELIKAEIYRKKLKAGLYIALFEADLDREIEAFIAASPCEEPLSQEMRITVALSPAPLAPVHDSIVYHYDKKEKNANQLIDGVDANELIIEYIKPQAGKSGRSCNGKAIEVREPSTKHAHYLQIDETLLKREDPKSIYYFSKIAGYVKNHRGQISISNEVSLKSASFKETGSIDPGKDRDVTVKIEKTKSSEDAVGTGVRIDVKELNVQGTVGSNVIVRANELSIGDQTHRNSTLEAVENATIKLHRGKLKAKTATIEVLETGIIIADEVKVKKMLGGEIIAKRVFVDELISNAKIVASERIEILSIFGNGNKLYIDPNKIEGYHEEIQKLQEQIKTDQKSLKASQLEYLNKHTAHKALTPRIKSFQKKIIAATQSGKPPLKADVIRIKQYKHNSELLKAQAQQITQHEQELQNLETALEKLYDADLHAKVIHKGVYDGQTQVIFVDTQTAQEYAITPDTRMQSIFLSKVGDDKMINWET
jgi:hypothetical protein